MRASGLSLAHDRHVVLDDVEIDVAAGELVVLTGEDGCGTTSLLRVLPGTLLDAPPGTDWSDDDVVQASTVLSALGGAHLADGLGHLDGAGVAQVLAVLRERADAGATVLLVAKGDSRAAAAADRVLVLDAGRLVASDA